MKSETGQQQTLAVLIDADNTSPSIVEPLFAEIAKYGIASVKRIYGDWTSPKLKGWKEILLTYAIHPVQQFRYTAAKNATDSAMIIDAMDLLYSNRFEGFCIISSDSDFTRLASRIREAGITVYGFGKRNTPSSLVNACDKFIYLEILTKAEQDRDLPSGEIPSGLPKDTKTLRMDTKLLNILRDAVDAVVDEDGWAHLPLVGQHISNQYPSFDSRNYGYTKLGTLIEATDMFQIDVRQIDKYSGNKTIYIRDKPRKKKRKKS